MDNLRLGAPLTTIDVEPYRCERFSAGSAAKSTSDPVETWDDRPVSPDQGFVQPAIVAQHNILFATGARSVDPPVNRIDQDDTESKPEPAFGGDATDGLLAVWAPDLH